MMITKRTWKDIEEIALDLAERYPAIDPMEVEFSELRKMITALPGFSDDPDASTDSLLESIQAAWYDEYED